MNPELLTANWALWVAALPATIAVLSVAWLLYRKSARGQLGKALKDHREALRGLEKAGGSVQTLGEKVERLESKADKVKPRVLQEARNALDDARALQRIMNDRAQVTRNLVRRAIFEEFPPSRHEKLRARYLPEDVESGRPFSF
jgi:outer membrane murein-binding lipoprotein Lpp